MALESSGKTAEKERQPACSGRESDKETITELETILADSTWSFWA